MLAKLNAPATIFMDEADAILNERGTRDNIHQLKLKKNWLQYYKSIKKKELKVH